MNDGVLLDVGNPRYLPDYLDDGVGEMTDVAVEISVVYLADTNGSIVKKRVFLVSSLEEVEVVVGRRRGGRPSAR